MLPLKLLEQPGDTVMLQLVPQRTTDIAREPSGTDRLASFGDEIFFQ